MPISVLKRSLFLFVVFSLVSLACAVPFAEVTNTPIPLNGTPVEPTSQTPDAGLPTATIAPTSTPANPTTLAICIGQEPNTLYPYGNPNLGARNVMAALYDGPVDTFMNGYQPVIVEKVPSIAGGDAQLAPVKVKRGDLVVDANNQPVTLDAGISVFPAGCTEESCAVRYDGTSDLEMHQLIVTFRFKPGLKWSDGQPLTAKDSVFAYKVASDPATPASKYLVDRTKTYEAADDLTVQWWGLPGFLDPAYMDNVWSPLPEHVLGNVPAAEIAKASASTQPPLGWGPYVFQEWQAGGYIRLARNPNYFRAAENLPAFDGLVFRFVKDAEAGISALTNGDCDLLDPSVRLEAQVNLLKAMESNEQVKTMTATTTLMERLDFGIRPATYDNAIATDDRTNFFGDVRMRRAIAYCLDREKVINTVMMDLTNVPLSFVPETHPVYTRDVAPYPYDTNKGIALLQEMGWLDEDEDINTPRLSKSIPSVPDETPLVLNYITTEALQRRQAADIFAKSLSECGIKLNVSYVSAAELYAPGPDGVLFGRKFDLAAYAMGNSSTSPFCAAWAQAEIPGADNNWIGINLGGYINADFDAACAKSSRVLPDNADYLTAHQRPQVIFANDMPSIPLYWRVKVAAARVDLCNFILDVNNPFDLWNIEELEINSICRNQ